MFTNRSPAVHTLTLLAALLGGCAAAVPGGGEGDAALEADAARGDAAVALSDTSIVSEDTSIVSWDASIAVDAPVALPDASDAAPDAEPEAGASPAREGLTRVEAQRICGVSVVVGGPMFAALYAVRSGDASEVRLSLLDTGSPAAVRTVVLARELGTLCVGRASLLATPDGLRATWVHETLTVHWASLGNDGAPTMVAAEPFAPNAPVLPETLVAREDGAAFVTWGRAGSALAAVGWAPEGGVSYRFQSALPSELTSVALASERVAYTTQAMPGSLFVRDWYAGARGLGWNSEPRPAGGGAPDLRVRAVTGRLERAGSIVATAVHGARGVSVSYLEGEAPSALRALADDTAWHDTLALPVSVSQAAQGGSGVLWATHDGGGYNTTLRFRALERAESCVVLRAERERHSVFDAAYVQRASRQKLLAVVLATGEGAVARQELRLYHLGDGEGLCGL